MKGTFFRRGSALGLMLAFAAPSSVLAFRSGPPPGRNGSTASGGATCRQCHGSSTGPGSVQIIGFPAQYLANALYDIDVRIQDSTKFGAGFQVSFETTTGAHVGTIIRTDTSGTQFNSGWLNHTSTGVNNSVANWFSMGNAAVYRLQWRAPASDRGPIRAWAAGNAINNNFTSAGDIIYLTNITATFAIARGACCDESSGTCTDDLFPVDCAALDDRYGGDGSTCATIDPPCAIVSGACCDGTTGGCIDDAVRDECIGDQHTFHEARSCVDLITSGECQRHRGACCDGTTGLCRDDVFPEECAGEQETWFKDTECTAIVCEQHRGACCDTSPGAGGPEPDGACTDDVLPGDCDGPQRIWAKATACADLDPPCLETPGACCDTLDGTCTDNVYSGDCQGPQRVWTKDVSCDDVLCDATLGACCDLDPFGDCTETTSAQCRCDQCVWKKLRTCDQIECVHNPIPTVSAWGLVVLTLLLLTGAKIYYGRLSESVASVPCS